MGQKGSRKAKKWKTRAEAECKRLRNGAGRGMRREGESFTRREEVQVEVEAVCSSWWMKVRLQAVGHWMNHGGSNQLFSGKCLWWPGGATSLTCCVCGVEAEGWIAVCSLLLPFVSPKESVLRFCKKQEKKKTKNKQTKKNLLTSERCGNFRLTEFCDKLVQLSEFFRRKQFSSSERLPQV